MNERNGEMVGSCMWQLWLERNNRNFKNKNFPVFSISMRIHHYLLMLIGQETPAVGTGATSQTRRDPRRRLQLQAGDEEDEECQLET